MKKKSLVMLLIVAMIGSMAMFMSSCGGSDTAEESAPLKCVTEATYAPFEFTEDGSDEIVGFDVDMMNWIAEDQGLTLEWVNIEFDSLIPALQSDQADLLCAGMNKLDGERQEAVDFGETYIQDGMVLLVNADSEIASIDDVTADMSLTSQNGTTGASYILDMEANGGLKKAVVLNQWTDCFMQLKNGNVDGIIIQELVAEKYMAMAQGDYKVVGEPLADTEDYAFAVKKGNSELLEKLNAGLKNFKDSGEYDKCKAKWLVSVEE